MPNGDSPQSNPFCLIGPKVQMSHSILHLSWTLCVIQNHLKLFFPHISVATCCFSSCSPILKFSDYVPVHKAQINKSVYYGHGFSWTHLFCTWYSLLHMHDSSVWDWKWSWASLWQGYLMPKRVKPKWLENDHLGMVPALDGGSSAPIPCRLGLYCLPIFIYAVILKAKTHKSLDQCVKAFLLI